MAKDATTTSTLDLSQFDTAPTKVAACSGTSAVAKAYAGVPFPHGGALSIVDDVAAYPVASRIAPGRPQTVLQMPFELVSDPSDPETDPPEDAFALRSVRIPDIASSAWVGAASDGVETNDSAQTGVAIVACGTFDSTAIVRDARARNAPSRVAVATFDGFTTLDWPRAVDPGVH
ncbi:MAG TPA: hypothetical protein VGI86_16835, partial [Acidimicrobiia bacterium]